MTDLVPASTDPPATIQLPDAEQSPVEVYLQSLGSVDSRRTMQGALDRLAELLAGERVPASAIPWHELRPDRTTWLRAMLLQQYKPSTVRKMLAALSGVLKQCWRLGLMEDQVYRRAIEWGQVKGEGLSGANAGRHVTAGEVRAMFLACADSIHQTTAARNATILAVLFGVGLRRAEVVSLDVASFDPENGQLTIQGKGSKVRIGYCTGGAMVAVLEWLRIRGGEPGPMFVAVNKAGRVDPELRRLTTQSVYAMLTRLAVKADVKHFSPHDARRTFGGNLFDAGVDAPTVQRLFGHASLATTGMYDRRGEETKKNAAGKLHIPYVGQGGYDDEETD
jgi:integrase